MRIRSLVFSMLAPLLMAFAADDSPYLKLTSHSKAEGVSISAQNVSGKAIVAYVILADYPKQHSTATYRGVYTEGDVFPANTSIDVATLPVKSTDAPQLIVDYVRLADGTTWGPATSAEAKALTAKNH
jgi:hypothetical protein